MRNEPSRREKRESKFYLAAEKGIMECKTSLFKSEGKSLKKQGFDVFFPESFNERKSSPMAVSWKNAFKSGIPLIVSNYIDGTIMTYPKSAINNWAQELYVIAARANHKKAQNKSE